MSLIDVVVISTTSLDTSYTKSIVYKYPEQVEVAKNIPNFCFVDADHPVESVYWDVNFFFIFTVVNGKRKFVFCKRGLRNAMPYCISLISDFPWNAIHFEILRILDEHFKITTFENISSIVDNILATPLPLPLEQFSIKNLGVTFKRPKFTDDAAPMGKVSFEKLIEALTVNTIKQALCAILLEKRVIFYSHKIDRLTECIQALLSLIYPFNWQFVLIPLLPPDLLSYCTAPMPFIIGIHSSEYEKVIQQPLEEVVFINLDENKTTLHERNDKIPERAFNHLKYSLEKASVSLNNRQLDKEIRKSARDFMLTIFGQYLWYFKGERGEQIFDRNLFVQTQRIPEHRKFLEEFVLTQMFEEFISERQLKLKSSDKVNWTIKFDKEAERIKINSPMPSFEVQHQPNQGGLESYMWSLGKKVKNKMDTFQKKLDTYQKKKEGKLYAPTFMDEIIIDHINQNYDLKNYQAPNDDTLLVDDSDSLNNSKDTYKPPSYIPPQNVQNSASFYQNPQQNTTSHQNTTGHQQNTTSHQQNTSHNPFTPQKTSQTYQQPTQPLSSFTPRSYSQPYLQTPQKHFTPQTYQQPFTTQQTNSQSSFVPQNFTTQTYQQQFTPQQTNPQSSFLPRQSSDLHSYQHTNPQTFTPRQAFPQPNIFSPSENPFIPHKTVINQTTPLSNIPKNPFNSPPLAVSYDLFNLDDEEEKTKRQNSNTKFSLVDPWTTSPQIKHLSHIDSPIQPNHNSIDRFAPSSQSSTNASQELTNHQLLKSFQLLPN